MARILLPETLKIDLEASSGGRSTFGASRNTRG